MRSVCFFALIFALISCGPKAESVKTSDVDSDYWVYDEDASTGERYFQVYVFSPEGSAVTVWNRYYPFQAQPDFYYWSARSGGSYEFKVDGDSVEFTYNYCLTGKSCRASCSDTATCEVWKTETYSGSGSLDDFITLNGQGKTIKLMKEMKHVTPVTKWGDSDDDRHFDELESHWPN